MVHPLLLVATLTDFPLRTALSLHCTGDGAGPLESVRNLESVFRQLSIVFVSGLIV